MFKCDNNDNFLKEEILCGDEVNEQIIMNKWNQPQMTISTANLNGCKHLKILSTFDQTNFQIFNEAKKQRNSMALCMMYALCDGIW